MFKYFLMVIGTTQITMALLGIFFPLRAFSMWEKWVSFRFFPLHGIALIFIGMPLTVYKGYLSTVIFYIGLLVVFSGPFILIYPEKIRKVFSNSGDMFKSRDIKIMIYVDALFRFSTGIIFLVSCWKTFL